MRRTRSHLRDRDPHNNFLPSFQPSAGRRCDGGRLKVRDGGIWEGSEERGDSRMPPGSVIISQEEMNVLLNTLLHVHTCRHTGNV